VQRPTFVKISKSAVVGSRDYEVVLLEMTSEPLLQELRHDPSDMMRGIVSCHGYRLLPHGVYRDGELALKTGRDQVQRRTSSSVTQSERNALDGVRVALLEARMSGELAQLVRRHGGLVRSAPAVREAPVECADVVADFLNRLRTPVRRVHVFLTGAGATALFQEAERQGQLPLVIESMQRGTVVCRGPKPAAALKRYGVSANVSAASPYTSHELLEAMAAIDLAEAEVTIVHYGERNGALADALELRGAVLNELCVYEWRLPEDIVPLQDVIRAIVAREIDAVVFTSQVQWKHLARVAADLGFADALMHALNTDVVVAAVGPVCSSALIEAGVRPHVVPENPKMGPLVAALARYFSAPLRTHEPDEPYEPHTGGG
jgi:uroporphyrinogen-III synthase